MATLNLNSNYAEQMLSLYLWGQTTAPTPSELADDKWIRPSDATSIAEVDAGAYMATVGSHLSLASQKIFQLFFNNEYRTGGKVELSDIANTGTKNGNEIVLNHKQFVGLLYGKLNRDDPEQAKIYNSAEKAELNLYHYRTNTDSEDYWQRAFTFGSSKFKLDTSSIKYVFDANTGKAIRLDDVQVQPLDTFDGIRENFDFESNQGIAKLVNPILNKIMDPSGIGRKVNIEFTGNGYFSLPSGSSYTQENYRDYIKKNSQPMTGQGYTVYPDTPTEELINIPELFNFWRGLKKLSESKIYDFLDENGKIVIYGSEKNDFITEFNAKNFSLDTKVKAYGISIPSWLLFNKFEKYLKKGITYIGGKDNDIISGTDYDDYIYGNDDRDDLRGQKGDDTLIGGLDVDTLYGGDNDDTLIGGISEDDPTDNNAQNELYGEAGNDTLKGSGRLEGGAGFDKYYAYDTAIIKDKDGKGELYYNLKVA